MTSKYETLEVLKGARRIKVVEVLQEKEKSLKEFKAKFGKEQTAADEKFFREKQDLIRQHFDMIQDLLEEMGFEESYKKYDITILVSEKTKN